MCAWAWALRKTLKISSSLSEARHLVEASVRRWLDDEMDNVLDELSVQVNRRKTQPTAAGATKKKVCIPILSDSFCLGHFGRGKLKIISRRIRILVERLNLIAIQRSFFGYQRIERSVGQIKRQKVLSLVERDKIFGCEDELEWLLSKLSSEGSEHERRPVVIPIVGMGGIGKTTLARLAYNHPMVKTHFEKRIWVCVSDPFDQVHIAKAIVETFDVIQSKSNELETLLRIGSLVENRKFLLVLDDVWTTPYSDWENFQRALQRCAFGSRVLVTTRNEEVARMMGGTWMFYLKSLSEEACFSLFHDCAQFDREKDGSARSEIARELVRRCCGLPLLTKILGSLMLHKETIKEWEDVLNSKIWELKEVQQQVFQGLLLSYYDLAPAVRPCLLYCAVFPKDFLMYKDSLVELWMSQDYLSSEENEEKETVGQRYFEDLVIRSFFQDFEKDEEGNIRWCKMHDIVHDSLQFLTKNECVTVGKHADGLGEPAKIHHLTLTCASQELSQSSFSISNCNNLVPSQLLIQKFLSLT